MSASSRRGRTRVALLPRHLQHNPYPELLTRALEAHGVDVVEGFDSLAWFWRRRRDVAVLHFNWLQPHYRHWRGGVFNLATALAFLLRLLAARALGYRLVWTMHNILPHDSRQRWLDRAAHACVAQLSSVVVHCPAAVPRCRELFGADATVVPHGDFTGSYAVPPPVEAARRALDLQPGERLFLFLGQVRPYKGVDALLDAWTAARLDRARLRIAGLLDPSAPDWAEALRRRVEGLAGVDLEEGFVADDRVSELLAACQGVVVPYRDFLTSGTAILAWSAGRPILLPRAGCYADAEEDASLVLVDRAEGTDLVTGLHRLAGVDPATAEASARIRRARDHRWSEAGRRLAALYRGEAA